MFGTVSDTRDATQEHLVIRNGIHHGRTGVTLGNRHRVRYINVVVTGNICNRRIFHKTCKTACERSPNGIVCKFNVFDRRKGHDTHQSAHRVIILTVGAFAIDIDANPVYLDVLHGDIGEPFKKRDRFGHGRRNIAEVPHRKTVTVKRGGIHHREGFVVHIAGTRLGRRRKFTQVDIGTQFHRDTLHILAINPRLLEHFREILDGVFHRSNTLS